MIILDGTTKFNPELRRPNRDKHLKTEFEIGNEFVRGNVEMVSGKRLLGSYSRAMTKSAPVMESRAIRILSFRPPEADCFGI
jgi:hypothetical protein